MKPANNTIARLRPAESTVTMRQRHRQTLLQIIECAAQLSATGGHIVDRARETLAKGGKCSIDPQLRMVTSAHARLLKDTALLEYLQTEQGIEQRGGEWE